MAPAETSPRGAAPLRIFGIVQIAACLLYGGVAFLALFGLAMCNDSGDNAFCGRAWLLWLAANVAALVNLVVGILMVVYRRPEGVATSPRMRVYVVVSVVAWLIIAAFVDVAIFGHPGPSSGHF